MRRLSLAGAGAVLALTLLTPGRASADAATADVYFKEGLQAMRATPPDWAKACAAFQISEKADASSGTEINLGLCNEKQEKFATAYSYYNRAVSTAANHQPAPQTERADSARKEADRVEKLLHYMTIVVKPPAPEGLAITHDGEPIDPGVIAFGGKVPLDQGEHVIEVSAKGKKTVKLPIKIPRTPGATPFSVPELEDAPVEKPAGGTPPGGDYRPPAGATENNSQRNWGLVVGGAGILALLVAGALQGLALIVNGDAKTINSNRTGTLNGVNVDCTKPAFKDTVINGSKCSDLNDAYDKKKSAAQGDQTGAIIVGATGVVMIGVGITLVLTSSSGSKTGIGPRIVPIVGPTQAGLGFATSF
jgi:hypothetical protein